MPENAKNKNEAKNKNGATNAVTNTATNTAANTAMNTAANTATKKRRRAWFVILIICIAVAAVAAVQLLRILYNYRSAANTFDELRQIAVVETEEEGEHAWWDGEMIDFAALQAMNPDIVAWIRFDNTDVINIDYPICWSGDNDTYLHADIYGEYTYAGTLFFEGAYEPFSDAKDIVYGHLMRDGSMFASLKKYTSDSSTYADNQYFTVYTPDQVMRYKIFSYFITTTGSESYEYGFQKKTDLYEAHLDYLCGESYVDEDVSANKNIMMLSTCAAANSSSRIVVFGKRIDTVELTE